MLIEEGSRSVVGSTGDNNVWRLVSGVLKVDILSVESRKVHDSFILTDFCVFGRICTWNRQISAPFVR